jgi:hypothetical protein
VNDAAPHVVGLYLAKIPKGSSHLRIKVTLPPSVSASLFAGPCPSLIKARKELPFLVCNSTILKSDVRDIVYLGYFRANSYEHYLEVYFVHSVSIGAIHALLRFIAGIISRMGFADKEIPLFIS